MIVGALAFIRKQPNRYAILVPVVLCVLFLPATLALQSVTDFRLTVFGLMILFVVYYLPDGIVGFLRQKIPALRPAHTAEGRDLAAGGAALIAQRGDAGGDALLKVEQVLMQFGGLKALAGIDLAVKPGTIHGLIGPNGSGKSTMMNVLTGIYKPTAGSVTLAVAGGRRLDGRTPSEIALSGVARTFQNVQLFHEMTALENVLVGLHHTFRGTIFDAILGTPAAGARSARPAPGPCRSSTSWGSAPSPRRRRATCPTASSACSRSAGRSPSTPCSCCSTSRPPASPRPTSPTSWRSSARSATPASR